MLAAPVGSYFSDIASQSRTSPGTSCSYSTICLAMVALREGEFVVAVVTHFALVSCQLKSKLTILTIVHGDVVREKKHAEEVIRLLTEIDAYLKENNSMS